MVCNLKCRVTMIRKPFVKIKFEILRKKACTSYRGRGWGKLPAWTGETDVTAILSHPASPAMVHAHRVRTAYVWNRLTCFFLCCSLFKVLINSDQCSTVPAEKQLGASAGETKMGKHGGMQDHRGHCRLQPAKVLLLEPGGSRGLWTVLKEVPLLMK